MGWKYKVAENGNNQVKYINIVLNYRTRIKAHSCIPSLPSSKSLSLRQIDTCGLETRQPCRGSCSVSKNVWAYRVPLTSAGTVGNGVFFRQARKKQNYRIYANIWLLFFFWWRPVSTHREGTTWHTFQGRILSSFCCYKCQLDFEWGFVTLEPEQGCCRFT